jgi:plastocyanin
VKQILAQRLGTLAVAALLALPACNESSKSDSNSATGDAAKSAITVVDPATAGSITVEVHYDGKVPEPKILNMRNAPQCAAVHGEPVKEPSLMIEDGRVANAVVWIKSGLEGQSFAVPQTPVLIDQKGCLYEPRVATAMVGQTVEFRNSDPEPHNVHGKPQVVDAWNFMISRQGATRTLKFDKEEIAVPIGCDIHPWMTGFVAVTRTPYAGVSDKAGVVSLKNLPPGNYTVGVWHEKLGARDLSVVLAPSAAVTQQLTFPSLP